MTRIRAGMIIMDVDRGRDFECKLCSEEDYRTILRNRKVEGGILQRDEWIKFIDDFFFDGGYQNKTLAEWYMSKYVPTDENISDYEIVGMLTIPWRSDE